MIRLIVADDQELVREGIAAILEAEADIDVVGSAADGAEALGLVHAVQPDVALMDIRMPAVDGVEATRRIVQGGSATKVLILTTFATDANVVSALRAGASGFLLKDAPKSSLLAAVRAVAAGDALLDASVLDRLVQDHLEQVPGPAPLPGLERLTTREREILTLVATGLSNDQIAARVFLSSNTVKTHVARTVTKLGARDRIHLVILAHTHGLV
jgi:DNA-binding NarL/FixJ family response regulator